MGTPDSKRGVDDQRSAWSASPSKAYSAKSELEKLYDQADETTFCFSDRLLLRHTLIVGSTGSGKTNHSFHLIREVCQSSELARFFVVDVKKDYRRLARILPCEVQTLAIGEEPRVRFNPLVPPRGVPTQQWDRAFSDIFIRAYGLREPSRRILLDSLKSLRDGSKAQPTLRELEGAVRRFKAESGREQGSQRSLDSRLHNINGGDVGKALNTEEVLDADALARVAIFEMGNVDSLLDQRFLVEFVLMHMWLADKKKRSIENEETLRRVMVIEEAHRFLSEDRPPDLRGSRTMLELAMAEARSYGWGFVIVDQMPTLLSRYVWDNVGSVLSHRLANVDSYERVKKAISGAVSLMAEDLNNPVALRLPEDLALFRRYVASPDEKAVGVTRVDRIREGLGAA